MHDTDEERKKAQKHVLLRRISSRGADPLPIVTSDRTFVSRSWLG